MNMVPFGSVCELQNGRAFKPEEWTNSGVPIVRIQNLNDESKPFNYCGFEVESRFHVDTGDLLFSWSGTPGTSFGAFFWNRGRGFLNQHIFRVDIDSKRIDKNYLRYAINSKLDLIIDQAHGGVGLKHITKGKLEAVEIPLPSMQEQKRIAAILDKADAIRRKRQQAIKLADDFLRSVFLEMFGDPVTNPKGWERCKFEDLTDMVTYGLTVRPEYIDDGIPLISAKEIRSGTINLEICSRISEADLDALSSKARPNYGDILFSKTGSIGHCALVDTEEPFAITQNAARIVPNAKRCISHFLLGLLRTKYFYNLANKEAKGNAVKDLQLGVMKSFPVYAPPLELQRKYSEIFKKFTAHSLLQEQAFKRAEDNFNSLSFEAFSGNL